MPDYFNTTFIKKKRLEEMIRANKVVSTVKPKTTNSTSGLKQSSVSFSLDIMHKRSNSDISVSDKKTRKVIYLNIENSKMPTSQELIHVCSKISTS
jgi:hypothetical protein